MILFALSGIVNVRMFYEKFVSSKFILTRMKILFVIYDNIIIAFYNKQIILYRILSIYIYSHCYINSLKKFCAIE